MFRIILIQRRNAAWRHLRIVMLSAVFAACSPIVKQDGYVGEPADLAAKLRAGEHTHADVMRLLGSPSATSSFGEDTWYYLSLKRERTAFLAPDRTDQKVLAVTFDETGRVARTSASGIEQARDLSPVAERTPTKGRKLGLFEQLFSNLGRFSSQKEAR